MLDAAAKLQAELISAQSELQALRQVYSDSNVRVRSAQARIAELEQRIGDLNAGPRGQDSVSPEGHRSDVFPSIRDLPSLGVTYADLYRQTETKERVIDFLNQQYELAKLQEVKETPSVRVLDPARVPDHRIFPSRLTIILIGTTCAVLIGLFWSASREGWDALDDSDECKQFAREVWLDMRLDWQHVRRQNSDNCLAPLYSHSPDTPAWSATNGHSSDPGVEA